MSGLDPVYDDAMTTITELPTTIGSIVTFDGWADKAKTERIRSVATLMPEYIHEGKAEHLIWADAYTDGESHDVFAPADILAGNPELFHLADSNPHCIGLVGETPEQRFGEVVTFIEDDDLDVTNHRQVLVYAPGHIDQDNGTMEEAGWVNALGVWFAFDTVLAGRPEILAKGRRD